MPVIEQTPVIAHSGNAVTTVFAYNFKILADADLEVTVDGTVKTLTTDYTVSGAGNDGGGSVTFGTAPASGTDNVVLRRKMALERTTDYQENGDLLESDLDDDADRPILILQEVKADLVRALKLPVGTATDQVIAENAAARANKGVKFDENGNLTISTYDPDEAQTEAAAYAAAAAASAGTASGHAVTAGTQAGIATTEAQDAETARLAAEAAQAAAEAAAATLPAYDSLTSEALNYVRLNAGEDTMEFRTPAEVLSDIGAQAYDADTAKYDAATANFTGTLQKSGSAVRIVGKETIFIPAGAMTARTTNGAASGSAETSTNKVMLKTLDFDTATAEYAQFAIQMPKSWNEGTVTFRAVWSHAATTTNFGVAWSLQGLALSDDDASDAAFGTKQTVTDTGGTTNDTYITADSSAITIAGSPAAQDWVVFQVERTVGDGADTMAIDARLHGIQLFYTTDAGNDA